MASSMLLKLLVVYLVTTSFSLAQSKSPCPLLWPDFPQPSSLSNSHAVQDAKQALSRSLQAALHNATIHGQLDSNATSFSVDVYSIRETHPLFTYHFSAPALAHPAQGVATVDSDTIYRIGSLSKLLTVYTYLIEVGDVSFNQPITKYVPELASYATSHAAALKTNEIDFVDWNSITIGALASHMAGISRDFARGAESDADLLASGGFPPVPAMNVPFCGDPIKVPCDRAAFFSNIFVQHPVEAPFSTPIYSNTAFQILAYALTSITSKPFPDLLNSSLLHPLKLDSTSYGLPQSNTSIVPINATISWYDTDLRDESPAGAYYSSIRDLRRLGTSILKSSLLHQAQTRRWMKPVAFTADPNMVVGAPWEIIRSPASRQSWMYTKSGQIGLYSSWLALLPDYNVGFTVLAAGTEASTNVNVLSNMMAAVLVPALEAAAREEAQSVYAGTYGLAGAGGANSSMTVLVDDQKPGLGVTRLVNNGTNILQLLAELFAAENDTKGNISVRLYPTSLQSDNDSIEKVSWRAVYEVLSATSASAVSGGTCLSWFNVNGVTYGGVGIDEYVFEIGWDGKATTAEQRALRSMFSKTNSTGIGGVGNGGKMIRNRLRRSAERENKL